MSNPNKFCLIFSFWFAGIAGGLTNLSKMPACNLMLLGAQRRTLSGFSMTSLLPHTGYIYHCDVVQSLPPVSRYINNKHTLQFFCALKPNTGAL